MNNSSTLQTNGTVQAGDDNLEGFFAALVTIQICIICIAIAGNLLVCAAIMLTERLRSSPTNYFLFSLAISDIMTAAFPMSFEVYVYLHRGYWNLGAPVCRLFATMYLIAAPSSVINLLAVSVDRYRAISKPLHYIQIMTPKKALITVFLIWVYVILFGLVPMMGWNTYDGNVLQYDSCFFDVHQYYSLLSSVINFVVPMIIMSVIYYLIYKIAHGHARRISRTETNFSTTHTMNVETQALTTEKKNVKRSIKAAKTVAIIVSAFFISWMPHTAVSIAGIFCKKCAFAMPYQLSPILLLVAYANSAMNPFLYAFHNREFREAFKRLLKLKLRSYR